MKKITILFLLFIGTVFYGFLCYHSEDNVYCVDFNMLFPGTAENRQEEPKKERKHEEEEKNIRVLIKNGTYESIFHEQISFLCDTDMLKITPEGVEKLLKNERYCLKASECMESVVRLVPCGNGYVRFLNIPRKDEVMYQGDFTCYGEKEGIVLVNELPIEKYLFGVVASEMPSSYPLEALKAQAVVARSYARYHMENSAYPQYHADVDDSTDFQVYQSVAGTEQTDKAVKETENIVMTAERMIQECMYYSTSAGKCPQKEKNFQKYIRNGKKEDLEYTQSWYRWECEVSISWEILKKRLLQWTDTEDANEICKASKQLKQLKICGRDESGRVEKIELETDAGKIQVTGQHAIRCLLAQQGSSVIRQDGTTFLMGTILPSPFFYFRDVTVKKGEIGLSLAGGGFGHGFGMSQNGAKQLALQGKSYDEILKYYYDFEISDG